MNHFEAFSGQNELEFVKRFNTKEACLDYLAYHKWKDGFTCSACGSNEEYYCRYPHHKRCKKCLHLDSATSGTLFHKVKFGLVKAFFIVFKMSATTKSVSAEQLAKMVGINRKSALLFTHKVRAAMKSSGKNPMKGNVEVDEAFIGGAEDGENRGRGAETKSLIAIAVEKSGTTGIKRVYALKIADSSFWELQNLFNKHICKTANVLTDKWKGYSLLKKSFNLEQEKSQPKENFKLMHRAIQQLKSWIRGIHHSVDPRFLQGYLNEFCYRLNRSLFKETIFDNLIKRMVNHSKIERKSLNVLYC